jgi:RNA polymerase sigma-70 factor (ECF subfamily)
MDPAEFGRRAREWAPRAVALARAICGDADAEDVAQEALIRAWRSIATLADDARFGGWLMTIVRNLARNQLRDRAAEPRPRPHDPARPPTEHERLRAAVDALPDALREVVRLRYEADLSYEEIAGALELDVGLVKSRLHEAKESLRAMLEG